MFKLYTKRALLALTLVVFASVGFNLDAKKHVYSTHTRGALTVYKQTNYEHCHNGCRQAPNVIKNCTSRCRACLEPYKEFNPDGVEFAWGAVNTKKSTEIKGFAVCDVDALSAWKVR